MYEICRPPPLLALAISLLVASGPLADSAPGKLPPTQQGLEISGKDVLVTAFGANPDGAGTVLRLWEYAGRSGPRQIRLPAGMEVTSVQPINLRGEPQGKLIAIRDRTFTCDLGAFAPASFLLSAPPVRSR